MTAGKGHLHAWLTALAAAALAFVSVACGSDANSLTPTSPTTNTSLTFTVVLVGGTTSLTVGQTAQFTATGQQSNGTTSSCTGTATWQSSNTSIVTVSASGFVTAIGVGDADIRATCQNVTGSVRVTVRPTLTTNGLLQIHYLDVGQGDAAVMITPGGSTVMFDDGPGNCGALVAALHALNITRLDYHIASHYHSDHIGCAPQVFAAFPLSIGLDRGGSYTTATYSNYVAAAGTARQTAAVGSTITLDQGTGAPVTIQIVAMDSGFDDENDRSIVAIVHFGMFDAEFGGDLTDAVEPFVAPRMSRVEAYKVHHHGSATATSSAWLSAIMPKIGIVSVGNGNSYHHPTQSALDRLHAAGVKTYWTEAGSGATPNPAWDVVAGTVRIEVQAWAGQFTVSWSGGSETYTVW